LAPDAFTTCATRACSSYVYGELRGRAADGNHGLVDQPVLNVGGAHRRGDLA
jgi:hypothetical protein